MARIGIISRYAAFGNAAALAEGMRKFADVDVWFRYRDAKGFDKQTEVSKEFPDCDRYIIIGSGAIGYLPGKYYKRKVTVIFTDTNYLRNFKKYNKLASDNKWTIFAMPDLAHLSGTENIYYHPFIMPDVDKRKTELVCHSPYSVNKEKQKGTFFISAVCAKNNLPLTIIKGKTWKESIGIKASHLICVDQLFQGIGKSGLEAMLLNCAVLSGERPNVKNLPPIVWTDKNNLNEDLVSLIFDKYRLRDVVSKQYAWALKNLDPEYVAGKIYEKL